MKYYLDTDIMLDVWYKINNKELLKRIILPPIAEAIAMIQFDDALKKYTVEIIAKFKEDDLDYSYYFNMTEFLGLNKINDFDLEFDYNKNKKELDEIKEIIFFNKKKERDLAEAFLIYQNNELDNFLFRRIYKDLYLKTTKEGIERVFHTNGIVSNDTKIKMLSKLMNMRLDNYDIAVEKFLQGDWRNEITT